MNQNFLRTFWNPILGGGLGCLAVSAGPLLIFGVLQAFGFFPGNNGLGLGLWFFFTIVPALALAISGIVVGVRRVDGSGQKRDVA